MKSLLRLLAGGLLLASATSRSLALFGGQEVLQDGGDQSLVVPGHNPLKFCHEKHEDYLVIDHVDLSPNPPLAGKNLTVDAVGVFQQDIEDGAYVTLSVKWNLIWLLRRRTDLCEQFKNVNLTCPIKKGESVVTKIIELPREIPPGRYTVVADVFTKDDKPITCLTAEVVFTLPPRSG
ncbi:MAG: Phosphatidylglycerol/phosphatidylinositol transfer protein [Phylliscum demangeonii]|nr:MAG: Phosphatidylglycerol/phosphatidylinositol transfer protein [Phylliscum demangeonii]